MSGTLGVGGVTEEEPPEMVKCMDLTPKIERAFALEKTKVFPTSSVKVML